MEDITCLGVTFIRNFDSANLAKVEAVSQDTSAYVNLGSQSSASNRILPESLDYEFNIWTKPDCGGTEFENGNRTWFYFGMRANAPSVLVKLNIVNLNKQAKMYSQGMCPVFKVVPSRTGWDRIRDKPTYSNDDDIFTLSFKYRTPDNHQAVTYFAFTYPFSYNDIQKMLGNIDTKFAGMPLSDNDDIYYVRECACLSLDKRRVDLLTITSKYGMSNIRETRLKNLFPDENISRPFSFPNKKVIFISARVHPGETPSSFVFNGLLHLLLNRDDPIAIALRRLYVFKLIPCLNPDGVARGHYRTDSRGVNLNRMYLNPSLSLHPSIFAARALIRYYHFGYDKADSIVLCPNCANSSKEDVNQVEIEDRQCGNVISSKVSHMSLEENENSLWKVKKICTACGAQLTSSSGNESSDNGKGDVSDVESGLFLYMDLHGHASKKGIFIYGNHFDKVEQNVECMLLAKLMSINNHNFHFPACNFSERNMFIKDKRDGLSRAGSGRVAISTLTGLVKSYTLECNYNTGRLVNVLPPTIKERQQKGYALPVPPKYSPTIFEEVGRSLGASILDLTGNNPLTRLPHSEFHTLTGVMEWIRNNCIQELSDTNQNNARSKIKSAISQGGKRRQRVRSTSSNPTFNKTIPRIRPASVPIDRKENIIFENEAFKPSCSGKIPKRKSSLKIQKSILKKSKTKLSLSLKCKNLNAEKGKGKGKSPVLVAGKQVDGNGEENQLLTETRKTELDPNNFQPAKSFVEKTIFTWNVTSTNDQMLEEKSYSFLKNPSEPGSSSSMRLNAFSKSSFFKSKKLALRRIGTTAENAVKAEKLKKKKRLVKKH